jgi:hypothetical protein
LAAKYGGKVQVIRVISGDNELSALEFQKHYRLGIVHVLDSNCNFEKRYSRSWWPFLMLVDSTGRVSWKGNTTVSREGGDLDDRIKKLVRDVSVPESLLRDGVSYMPESLRRSGEVQKDRLRERFCSIACGPKGRVYVVYTSNRNGNSDVFLRMYDGAKRVDDIAIAGTDADEFDGTVLVDKENRVWVSWTSNSGSKQYNIFVKQFSGTGTESKAMQVTRSRDDAMHGRMACDGQGRIWMTYYKWQKIGRNSRDKEVYVRSFDGKQWSDEIQVGPKDVSEYEDHSDPVVAGLDDGALVCWSWDYHKPKGYPKNASEPTIFVRKITGELKLGKVLAVSTNAIDVTPVIGVSQGDRLWSAWDSLSDYRKSLCVRQFTVRGGGKGRSKKLSGDIWNVCSACFAAGGPDGLLTLIWSQTNDGRHWMLKRSDLAKRKTQWSKAVTIRSKGNPRFCSGAYDSNGDLWIACSVETEAGREVEVIGPRTKKPKEKGVKAAKTGSIGKK